MILFSLRLPVGGSNRNAVTRLAASTGRSSVSPTVVAVKSPQPGWAWVLRPQQPKGGHDARAEQEHCQAHRKSGSNDRALIVHGACWLAGGQYTGAERAGNGGVPDAEAVTCTNR
jgi:hypothetical protein